MATVDLTVDNFDDTIEEHDIVLLDFWAEWCGPCKQFAPIYEAVSEKHDDVLFGKVDTESQQQIAAAFQISAIPTLVIFRGQIPIFRQPGVLPPKVLEDLIQQVRDLDMDDVREKYEEALAQHSHEHNHEHGPDCNHDHNHDHGDD